MNGYSIYETYKQSTIEIDERNRYLLHHASGETASSGSLRYYIARRAGQVLLKWGQVLLHYSDPSAYRADAARSS